jgi:arylsulfatase
VPTVYELLGIDPPDVIRGAVQLPIEGESFASALIDATVPGKRTQFYTMLGQRALYHEGWLATAVHPPLAGWGAYEKDEWELYHLERDRAQAKNLAAEEPARLELLKGLWWYYAGVYNGLPLDDRSALEQVLAERPRGGPPRDQYVFYPGTADVPESAGPVIPGRSYTLSAGVRLDSADAQGVIWAAGGIAGGHALYVQDRRLCYSFNWVGSLFQDVVATRDVTPGPHVFTAEFSATGRSTDPEHPGTAGTVTLYVDEDEVGTGDIITQPGYFCITGDGISVGKDSGSAVTPRYAAPFPFTGGTIDKVVMDLSGEHFVDHEAQVIGWFLKD